MKVVVGSLNPVKINAVKVSFSEAFPNEKLDIIPFNAPSQVSEQPIGRDETKEGANNRATACKTAYPDADFFVGLEGGLEENEGKFWTVAWMCILDKEGRVGFGSTGAFLLPPQITTLIKEGMELGLATDMVFNESNSGKKGGAVGALTNNIIDRTEFYRHALIFALIPHLKPKLYTE